MRSTTLLLILASLCIAISYGEPMPSPSKRGFFSSLFGGGSSRSSRGSGGSNFLKDMAIRKGLSIARKYGQRKGGMIGKGINKAADMYERRRYGNRGGSSSFSGGRRGSSNFLGKLLGGGSGSKSQYSSDRGYSGSRRNSYSGGGSSNYRKPSYNPSPSYNSGGRNNNRPSSYNPTPNYSNNNRQSTSGGGRGNNVDWSRVDLKGQGNKDKETYKEGLSDLADLMN